MLLHISRLCACVLACRHFTTKWPTLVLQCADSWAHEEQQVINSPNGLNKHDSRGSAVRQSEVRGAHKSLEANREKKMALEERWRDEGALNKRGTGRVKATTSDTPVMISQVNNEGHLKFFASGHSRLNLCLLTLTLKAYTFFFFCTLSPSPTLLLSPLQGLYNISKTSPSPVFLPSC